MTSYCVLFISFHEHPIEEVSVVSAFLLLQILASVMLYRFWEFLTYNYDDPNTFEADQDGLDESSGGEGIPAGGEAGQDDDGIISTPHRKKKSSHIDKSIPHPLCSFPPPTPPITNSPENIPHSSYTSRRKEGKGKGRGKGGDLEEALMKASGEPPPQPH
jgi:hypothetical protein